MPRPFPLAKPPAFPARREVPSPALDRPIHRRLLLRGGAARDRARWRRARRTRSVALRPMAIGAARTAGRQVGSLLELGRLPEPRRRFGDDSAGIATAPLSAPPSPCPLPPLGGEGYL